MSDWEFPMLLFNELNGLSEAFGFDVFLGFSTA